MISTDWYHLSLLFIIQIEPNLRLAQLLTFIHPLLFEVIYIYVIDFEIDIINLKISHIYFVQLKAILFFTPILFYVKFL